MIQILTLIRFAFPFLLLTAFFCLYRILNRKIAESTFHLLHERKRLWFATLLLSMVCYTLPYMNSMFLFLFAVSVAVVFYPSKRVLQLKNHPEAINNPKDLLALIIRNYY